MFLFKKPMLPEHREVISSLVFLPVTAVVLVVDHVLPNVIVVRTSSASVMNTHLLVLKSIVLVSLRMLGDDPLGPENFRLK